MKNYRISFFGKTKKGAKKVRNASIIGFAVTLLTQIFPQYSFLSEAVSEILMAVFGSTAVGSQFISIPENQESDDFNEEKKRG